MAAHLAPLRRPVEPSLAPLKLLRALPGLFAALHSGHGVGALLDPHSHFGSRLEADLQSCLQHDAAGYLRGLEGPRFGVRAFSLPQRIDHAFHGLPSRHLSGLAGWLESFGGALCVLPVCDPVESLDLWRNAQSIFDLSRRIPVVFLGETRVQMALLAEGLRLAGIPMLPSLPVRADDPSAPPLAYAIEINPYPQQGVVNLAPVAAREAFECLVEHCRHTMHTHPDHEVGQRDAQGRILLTGDFSLDPHTGEVFEDRPDPFAAITAVDPHATISVRLGRAPCDQLPPPPPAQAPLIQRLYWSHLMCSLWESE